jgi:hypothetical protein
MESKVVELLQSGLRLSDIAKLLHISVHTVRNHLKHVFRKLGVHSQVELLALHKKPEPFPAQLARLRTMPKFGSVVGYLEHDMQQWSANRGTAAEDYDGEAQQYVDAFAALIALVGGYPERARVVDAVGETLVDAGALQ